MNQQTEKSFCLGRARGVLLLVSLLLMVMIGRVGYLQTYGREHTIRSAERQQHQIETLPARRGTIFDRNGTLLAGTIQQRDLFIDPKFLQDYFEIDGHKKTLDESIDQLARILDKKPFELAQLLGDRYESRYLKIASNLDEQTCDAITKLNLPGVGFSPENIRYYPDGSLAAHLLGGTGKDGHGLDGLELRFDPLLAGHDGSKRVLKDARRHEIAVAADDYHPPEHGRHLILTIDANIQMIAEQELADTCEKNKAKRGEVVVMDPRTGEVLALANWPTFNPQNLEESSPETRANKALVYPYEPGSTIKPFIVGPALNWRVTTPEEVWNIPAQTYTVHYDEHHSRSVKDVHFYGKLATWDVLVKSSNIGMSMLGERLGNPRLYEALTGFGFGHATGIELPGEDPGRINPLVKWNRYSTESVAQGYEIMVTPLQLCRAFCVYANGGFLVTPHMVRGVLDEKGNIVPEDPALPHRSGVQLASSHIPPLREMPRVPDAQSAANIRRILCDVVVRGTATKARSKTWNIFGKTGTAHISEGRSGYSDSKFNSSFLGGAPAEDPRLVIAMVVHEPDKSIAHYGGAVSAPGASHIIERSLTYLQVPESPDLPAPSGLIASVLHAFDPALYHSRSASIRD